MCIIDFRRQRQRGLTVAEMWLALAVSGVVITALLGFTIYSAKSFAALTNYVDLEQKSQIALDTMTREVRQTQYLISYGTTVQNGRTITNALRFMDSDNLVLTYLYQSNALFRTKSEKTTMLLTNCDFLSFQIFQRNPVGFTYDQFPTSVATNCKLVSVSWVCSRSILGSKLNTESVQTAKIVIRKS